MNHSNGISFLKLDKAALQGLGGWVRHMMIFVIFHSSPSVLCCVPWCQLGERPPVRPSSSTLTTINIPVCLSACLTSSLARSQYKQQLSFTGWCCWCSLWGPVWPCSVLTVLTVLFPVWGKEGEETEQLVWSPPAITRHWLQWSWPGHISHTRPARVATSITPQYSSLTNISYRTARPQLVSNYSIADNICSSVVRLNWSHLIQNKNNRNVTKRLGLS